MKKFFIWIAVFVVLFEEWLWDTLKVLGETISHVLCLDQIEVFLENSKPWVALIAIAIPVVLVTPLNLYALLLLTEGRIMEGVILEVFAKLLGTLMISRVFMLTKPQLLTIPAFNYVYTKVTTAINWAHKKIKETSVYQTALLIKAEIKKNISQFKVKVKQILSWPY